MLSKINRSHISSHAICDYYYKMADEQTKPVALLLHGFAESGSKILNQLKEIIPEDWGILAPNGPFPLPKKNRAEGTWNLNFAWYFFDASTKKYFIDQSYSQEILTNLIQQELKINNPIHIIGYSQGGYLAPFIGLKLENTVQTIAINAEYKYNLLPQEKFNFSMHGINGVDDDVVDPINAQNSHQKLLNQGNIGQFFLLEDTAHPINDQIHRTLQQLVN